MTAAQILTLMTVLYARPRHASEAADRSAYAAAFASAGGSLEDVVRNVVLGHYENWYHRSSRTPPLGLVDWTRRHRRPPTREEAARLVPPILRFLETVRCPGASRAAVLGRYHHGEGTGDRHGCYPDRLSLLESRDVVRGLRWARSNRSRLATRGAR